MAFRERWDILDENGTPSGRTIFRGDNSLKSGEYHLVVHIWVLSPDGRILIQKRSAEKKLMPGEWAATGGAAVAGEDSYTAAHRELFEELGLDPVPENFKKIARIKRRNSLLDVWITVTDRNVEDFVLQKSEVERVKWVTFEEIVSMIESGQFHNYGKEYYDTVFAEIENYRRAII